MADKLKIVIISGPNGAGKTTFAREFLPHEASCPVYVNADLIAAGLSPFKPEVTAVRMRGKFGCGRRSDIMLRSFFCNFRTLMSRWQGSPLVLLKEVTIFRRT